ncbi:hypothetical protein BJV77DRAFT_965500 [Russula vinacea]|nr:hypothetical protein BJV77DRAFT_965500 [Russula vinacea]
MELAPGTSSWTLCWTLQSNTAILATLTDEKIMEELEQIGVAQLVIKLQGTGTMRLYFLLISGCLKPLPRKGSAEETNVNNVDLVLLREGLMEPIDRCHREETLWGITGLLTSSVGKFATYNHGAHTLAMIPMAMHELLSKKKGCLKGKLLVAEVEQVLKRWAQLMTITL